MITHSKLATTDAMQADVDFFHEAFADWLADPDVMNQTIREPAVLNKHVVCSDDAGASSHLSSRFVSRTLATLSSLNVLTN